MKHSALSMLLLFGIGFSPALGLLGGGDTNYAKDPEAQQSTGDTAETGTKATGDETARQKTAENHGVQSCTEQSACPYPGIHSDQ